MMLAASYQEESSNDHFQKTLGLSVLENRWRSK
jgi:hypothetical protein